MTTTAKKNHPLHPLLQWDDAEAALAYRTHKVASIISSVRVTVKSNGDEEKVPAFAVVSFASEDPDDEEPGRRTVGFVDMLEDETTRGAAIISVVKLVGSHLPRVEACGEDLEFLRKAIRKAQRLCGLV